MNLPNGKHCLPSISRGRTGSRLGRKDGKFSAPRLGILINLAAMKNISTPPSNNQSRGWTSALDLNHERKVVSGSYENLRAAINRGADLRINTDFYFHEHLEPGSPNQERVNEVSEFATTYLIEKRWVAGVMTRRMPINSLAGFGPRPSMSFFLYNENGEQGIARPYLDNPPLEDDVEAMLAYDHSDMVKYHERDSWDVDTNAPSSNFVYDFELFRYFVNDSWQEVYANNEQGEATFGSLESLVEAFLEGAEIKVGISDLSGDLAGSPKLNSEVFVQVGPGYYHREGRLFYAGTHPTVRIAPGIPMRYFSYGWDFGSFIPRTDGIVYHWVCDPYSLVFKKSTTRNAVRWFVRR